MLVSLWKVGIFTRAYHAVGKKGSTDFGPGESVVLLLCENLEDTQLLYIYCIYIYIYILFNNFFNSPMLKSKLLENDIYEIHTVRPNLKHMSSLKPYKQLKMWTASLARM